MERTKEGDWLVRGSQQTQHCCILQYQLTQTYSKNTEAGIKIKTIHLKMEPIYYFLVLSSYIYPALYAASSMSSSALVFLQYNEHGH